MDYKKELQKVLTSGKSTKEILVDLHKLETERNLELIRDYMDCINQRLNHLELINDIEESK